MTVRGLGFMFWVSGLYGAAFLLLQGVAQLEGETLARLPETPEGLRGRLKIVGVFLAAAFCGWLVYLAIDVFWNGSFPDYRTRLLCRWPSAWEKRAARPAGRRAAIRLAMPRTPTP
jgi:hypothetical protein